MRLEPMKRDDAVLLDEAERRLRVEGVHQDLMRAGEEARGHDLPERVHVEERQVFSIAKNAVMSSGRFVIQSPTLSPLPMPRAMRVYRGGRDAGSPDLTP